ncbi:hypothetical protein T265_13389, partial [Opisthorchis viverrini]
ANKICCLEPFSHCYNLQELYLRGNQITDIHEVAHLKWLFTLQKIWLQDNPFTSADDLTVSGKSIYSASIVRNLQHLTHLDHTGITPEERAEAESFGLMLLAPPHPTSHLCEQTSLDDTENLCSTMDSITATDLESDITEAHSAPTETLKSDKLNESEKTKSSSLKRTGVKSLPTGRADFVTSSPVQQSEQLDSCYVTVQETNKIRQECGLKPLNKNKISPPARLPSPTMVDNERLVRNAVLRLLKTLNQRSLETVVHAAERRLVQLKRVKTEYGESLSEHLPTSWMTNDDYDFTNYLDTTTNGSR